MNKRVANYLVNHFGGHFEIERGCSVVYVHPDGRRFVCRASCKDISVRQPSSYPVDGLIYQLSGKLWGRIDFNGNVPRTVGTKQAVPFSQFSF